MRDSGVHCLLIYKSYEKLRIALGGEGRPRKTSSKEQQPTAGINYQFTMVLVPWELFLCFSKLINHFRALPSSRTGLIFLTVYTNIYWVFYALFK